MTSFKVHDDVNDLTFDIEMQQRVVVIYGDSATGKSLLVNIIKALKKAKKSTDNYISDKVIDDIEVFNDGTQDGLLNKLRSLQDKIIIIDNYDYLNNSIPGLDLYIMCDTRNYYLIMGRDILTLSLGYENFAQLKENDRTFSLDYEG